MIKYSDEYRKKTEKYLLLDLYLKDILTYVNDTINYLKSDNKDKYDVDEIIMYLSSIPETIYEIKNIIQKMEVILNEQL